MSWRPAPIPESNDEAIRQNFSQIGEFYDL